MWKRYFFCKWLFPLKLWSFLSKLYLFFFFSYLCFHWLSWYLKKVFSFSSHTQPCFVLVLLFVTISDMVPWEDMFDLGASAAPTEYHEWFQIGIDVNMSHQKYQIKTHLSPCFSLVCAATRAHTTKWIWTEFDHTGFATK